MNESDIKEVEMISEIQCLKESINNFKMMQLEDAKYK